MTVMEQESLTIRRAISGDEAHSGPSGPGMLRTSMSSCAGWSGGDADLAADIAQEVWIQIFRALPSYRGDAQFGTWAHRIAVNRTLNALRKTRRLANIETDVHEDTASVEPDHDRTFVAESIEQATARLSPGARAVFMLHDVEGYTHEEIADALGITSGGSKSQLFKARAKLRMLLAHLIDGPDVRSSNKGMGHVAPAY